MAKRCTAPRTTSILKDGVILPPNGMEVIVSDHCNISCAQCNHGAPALRKWNVDPKQIGRELAMLGAVYRPAFVKLIGGEPLLHPKLVELATTVRNSGISDHLMLVTNGMLLDRMAPEMWDLIDELEISRYPGAGLDDAALARHEKTANRHGVGFTLNTYDDFRETFSAKALQDPELVSKTFRACKIANVWGCHGLYRGRIYRCPQSMYALSWDPSYVAFAAYRHGSSSSIRLILWSAIWARTHVSQIWGSTPLSLAVSIRV